MSWFDEWRVENALLAGRDIEGPLLEFTSRPEANIDGFFRLIDRLLYHGRTTELLMALAPAWSAIKDSPDVTEGGKELLKQIAADVVVDHQLSLDSNAEQCAPELLEQIVAIVDCDRAQIDKSLRQRAGDRESHWCVEDFAGGTDRKDDRLQLLVMDFSRHLRSRTTGPHPGPVWRRTRSVGTLSAPSRTGRGASQVDPVDADAARSPGTRAVRTAGRVWRPPPPVLTDLRPVSSTRSARIRLVRQRSTRRYPSGSSFWCTNP